MQTIDELIENLETAKSISVLGGATVVHIARAEESYQQIVGVDTQNDADGATTVIQSAPCYKLIEQPLTKADMDEDGGVTGIVEIDLYEIIDFGLEGFLNLISTKLVGNDLLMDINYHVVGCGKMNAIHIMVDGDAREAFGLEVEED